MSTKTQRIFSYIMTVDNGAAPNADNGMLSLAICKPMIRRGAKCGDVIIGISGKKLFNGGEREIVYIAKITKVVTMKEYAVVYPKRKDSIYTSSLELRENPYHTEGNRKTDISGENVLLSTDFIYYGTNHISVPSWYTVDNGRGHRTTKNKPFQTRLIDLFDREKRERGTGKIGLYSSVQNKKCGKREESTVKSCTAPSSDASPPALSCAI